MAQRRSKAVAGPAKRFPPEADGQFEVVPEVEIAAWREKLDARYGIGTGKLKVVDDPFAAA